MFGGTHNHKRPLTYRAQHATVKRTSMLVRSCGFFERARHTLLMVLMRSREECSAVRNKHVEGHAFSPRGRIHLMRQ